MCISSSRRAGIHATVGHADLRSESPHNSVISLPACQSTYEDVARDTNRGHTVAAVGECFHLAKDAGFKVCTCVDLSCTRLL